VARPDPLTLYADNLLVDGWCLRSGLVRYAQAEAKRATVVHALMRRFDAALATADADRKAVLADVIARFDALALVVAQWAANRSAHAIPNGFVDEFVATTLADFERLDVPEESIDPTEWRGMRSSEGRRPAKKT
jgi:hypothetical protein